ncbi:hypothetical protein ACJJTC_002463 [Scirpophaga incertulas]
MQRIMCVTFFFLAIYGVRSYILVTANLDDIQTIAKQLLESSVTEQLSDIWRRASNRYARQLDDQQTRKTNDQEDSDDNKGLCVCGLDDEVRDGRDVVVVSDSNTDTVQQFI